jgi:AcrR family transcriptional regulator
MDPVKRSYRSPTREAQAARTRDAIVGAARRLLTGGGGLRGATMETIAAEAGVSVQTVYATYGSKTAILIALLDRLETDAVPGGGETGPAGDPGAQLKALVGFHRRRYERGADVIAVGLGSAAGDPDVAAHVDTGHRRRRAAQAALVGTWHREGALRDGLSRREAADVLWALTSPDLYLLHVRGSGWSPSRYATWLTRTLEDLLLAR